VKEVSNMIQQEEKRRTLAPSTTINDPPKITLKEKLDYFVKLEEDVLHNCQNSSRQTQQTSKTS